MITVSPPEPSGEESGVGAELLQLTAELVDIPSPSFHEQVLVAELERRLLRMDGVEVTRVGDNVVARTDLGRPERLVLAGHSDTVPESDGNGRARVEGDRLWGLGAADMKGGLAIMVQLLADLDEPAVDVTAVIYAREEVAGRYSGLAELIDARPDLVAGDAAVLGEPTAATIEAGCQGTMRHLVTLAGRRAHTARAWRGRNAIHRLADVLAVLERYEPRQPVIDGLTFHEALQAVEIAGGVAGNVVPDEASVLVNHRYAPDRSPEEADAHVREVLAACLESGDRVERTELAGAAHPTLAHPLLAALVEHAGTSVSPKLGWTDVARMASIGVPAVNYGPGDPHVAHETDEHVDAVFLQRTYETLASLIATGPLT